LDFLSFSHDNPLSQKHFDSLVKAQIYCWGREPFWEFKKCCNASCGKVFSIDAYFKAPSLNQDFLHKNFQCLECWSDTESVYEWGDFSEELRVYFSQEVQGILLVHEDEVRGFNVLRKTDAKWLFEYEFSTRKNGFQSPELSEIIIQTLGQCKSLICWQHLFIDEPFRSEELFWDMLYRLSIQQDGQDIPVIVETRYESRVYPFLRLLWFQDVCQDKYWYVSLFFPNFKQLKNNILHRKNHSPTSISQLKGFLRIARQKSKEIHQNNHHVSYGKNKKNSLMENEKVRKK